MRSVTVLLLLGAWVMVAQAPVKRVTRAEAIGALVSKVQPEYPPVARQLKLEGTVELEALIAESGSVEDVTILSGNPVLTRPAVDAVRKWKFTPFLQEGKPTRVSAPITIVFKKQ